MRYLLGCLLALLAVTPVASAQQLRGTFSLTGEAGYLTNAYLDPAFPVWERTARAPFLGLMPTGQLEWSNGRNTVMLQGRGRYTHFMNTETTWWLGQGLLRAQRRLGGSWTVGLEGAGSRLQTAFGQWVGWGGPYIRWQLAPQARLGLRAGGTARRVEGVGRTYTMTSPFFMLEADWWHRAWYARGSTYYSRTQETETSGLGLMLQGGRRVSDHVQVGLQGGTDRYGYAAASPDRLWRTAANLKWAPADAWTLTTSLGLQHLQRGTHEGLSDIYASAGLTYRWQTERSAARPPAPLWVQEREQVRFQVPYDGEGRLFLVGDFNDWEEHDIRLRRDGGGLHTAELELPPGTYQYRVQIVRGGETNWLTLPDHALTIDDGFGDENGMVVVTDENEDR